MHALVFPSDTCWLIESIRLSLFISFSWDWGSLLSPAGRLRHNGSTGFGLTGLHLIFRIRALHLTQTPPGLLAVLFVLTCVLREGKKKKKKHSLFSCYMVARKHRGLLKQTECRCLWCGKKKEGRGRSRWRDEGITSSLPTRQPWVPLLCWSECNRPGFFSLTTGACEHTSSPPWERRLSWQSQCLFLLFFFLLLSFPAPHLCLCLILSSFLSCLCFLSGSLSLFLFHCI